MRANGKLASALKILDFINVTSELNIGINIGCLPKMMCKFCWMRQKFWVEDKPPITTTEQRQQV